MEVRSVAPRASAMAICREVVPPELTFDGVRIACHLYQADGDGRPVLIDDLADRPLWPVITGVVAR